MVVFPDGSSVWINDADGTPLEEWKEEVRVDEEHDTHITSVCE